MSHKIYDHHGRWRNKTIAFRLSPEENEELNRKVRLSGRSKQDYLGAASLGNPLHVQGSQYVISQIKEELAYFTEVCQKNPDAISGYDQEVLAFLLEEIRGFAKNGVNPMENHYGR